MGTLVYLQYGWRAGAGLSVGLAGFMLAILLLRGPHTKLHTWFGYEGGMEWRKRHPTSAKQSSPDSDATCLESTKPDDGKAVEVIPSSAQDK